MVCPFHANRNIFLAGAVEQFREPARGLQEAGARGKAGHSSSRRDPFPPGSCTFGRQGALLEWASPKMGRGLRT